jgi:hypothetical protein
MIDLPASIGFQPSYPQLTIPVSQTKYGGRTISTVEYADSYRTVDMETVPLTARQAVQLQSFIAAARGGAETIVYRPTHICIPQAYWGDPNNPHITGTASLGTVTGGYTVQLTSVVPRLILKPGDMFSLKSGDYRQMLQVVIGGVAASTTLTVKVDQPISSYVGAGAIVRFKRPEMNTRLVKDSFQMANGHFPTASFQLIEVPR